MSEALPVDRRSFLADAVRVLIIAASALVTFCYVRLQLQTAELTRHAEAIRERRRQDLLRQLERIEDDVQDLNLRVNRLILERDMPPPVETMQFIPIAPDPTWEARLLQDERSLSELYVGLGVPYHLYQHSLFSPYLGENHAAPKVPVRATGCPPTVSPLTHCLRFDQGTHTWRLLPLT